MADMVVEEEVSGYLYTRTYRMSTFNKYINTSGARVSAPKLRDTRKGNVAIATEANNNNIIILTQLMYLQFM